MSDTARGKSINKKIKQSILDAVELTMKYQIGFPLKKQEVENLVKFLKTLTGEKVKIIGENRDEKSN